MMKVKISILFAICCFAFQAESQSYAFGIKGGPSVAMQKWNGYQSDYPLIAYHGIAFIESADEVNYALFAELGYHVRGVAFRHRAGLNPYTGQTYEARTIKLMFNNIGLNLGGKKKFNLGSEDKKWYYLLGVRGEYNLSRELAYYNAFEEYTNRFTYGVSVGAGLELPFSELIGSIIELRISPDLSKQVYIPPLPTFRDPYTGQERTSREQNISNITLELSVGIRFMHIIEYID